MYKKNIITSLKQLATDKAVAEILCAAVKEFNSVSLADAKQCIDSVSVDNKAVHVKAHLPDGKNVQLLIGILPNRKPSPYDLISKKELEKILLDENLYNLCFIWIIPDPDKPPKFNPITSDMVTQFANADKNLLDVTSMCVLMPSDEFWS